MFGYLIHRSYNEVREFDKENNSTKWVDDFRDEMDCIKEKEAFITWKGPNGILTIKILNPHPNHQMIRVNLIFAVKYNGRHKARLVADGSLTAQLEENIYSGVVSMRHLRLVTFLGDNRKCGQGNFKAPCLVSLRMLLQLTYYCSHNQWEY